MEEIKRMTIPLTDEELMENIKTFVKKYGVNPELKGFQYMCDMIFLMKKKKKYSRMAMEQLAPELAEKYGIKWYSFQRQLRYAVTIKNLYGGKLLPVELMDLAYKNISSEKIVERN